MATKKKTYKTAKKIAKKVSKSKYKVVFLVIFFIALGICAFLGFEYYQEKKEYDNFCSESNEYILNLSLENEVTEDFILPKSDNLDLVWSSSDESVITKDGKVTRPSYSSGDKLVTLTVKATYSNKTFLYSYVKGSLGEEVITKSFKILVKALPETNLEICYEVLDSINLPNNLYASIDLPLVTFADGVSLTWNSSNKAILKDTGEIVRPQEDTLVSLKCVAKRNEDVAEKTFECMVMANDPLFYEFSDNFDGLDETTRYQTIKNNTISYYNVMVNIDPAFDASTLDPSEVNSTPNFLKLRSNKDSFAYFESEQIASLKNIKLKYQYISGVKNTNLKLYVDEGTGYNLVSTEKVELTEWHELTFDLSTFHNFKFKLVFENEYATNTYIYIDDVIGERDINENDLFNSINLNSTITKSIVLPFTTYYGGTITWQSLNESLITSNGVLLNKPSETTSVTLKANLKYNDKDYVFTFTVNVKGNTIKDSVEIYFIDLGQSGLSDCGESTYIKYGSIDILVDSGDDFSSSHDAIREVINENSEDLVIEYLIATHPDSDHIGNMASIFSDYQVNNLYKFNGEDFNTQKFKNLKAAYDSEPNCNVYDIYNDVFNGNISDYIYITNEIYIQFINTGYLLNKETNGRSVVFVLNIYGTRILMTGDADSQSAHPNLEKDYMNQVGDIDILKVAHHGTQFGTPRVFLDTVKPELAIVCNGNYLGNKHGHPHPLTIDTLDEYSKTCANFKVYAICGGGLHCEMTAAGSYKGVTSLEESLVDRNGTIKIVVDDNTYVVSSQYNGLNLIDLRDTTYYKSYLNLNN